jgi:penicillin amidase
MPSLNGLIGSVLSRGLTWLSRRGLQKIDGSLNVTGLESSVEVIRDRWGIPHIYAANSHDLFFTQGFIHAQDRLFQMEINRRTAQGLLSELFGSLALETDRATRTFGFNRLGRIDWQNATPEVREVVLAYTQGVNAYLSSSIKKLPVEFTLLNHHPKPWQAEDSMAFARVMMWQLSHAWYVEIVRAQLVQAVGEDHAAELEIEYPADNPTVLPKGVEFNLFGPDSMLHPGKGPFIKNSMGSNGWVVSGNKSATGNAFLCNDMHLALGQPAIWYDLHLQAGDYNVTGVSLPGTPGVLVGHNAHIAWGMTLAFTDCEDLFIEKFDPQNPTHYLFRDNWQAVEVVAEPIPVKGKSEPYVEQVIITHHGPVISDVVGYPEQRLAVNSMALRPSPSLQAWLNLDRANGWDEFVEAMHLIDAPQLNVVYADVEGNIGYWVTGKVPVRAKGDGSIPAPGWSGEYEWVGEVPFAEMPHAFNPEAGFIVTTNNRIVPEDYPHFLGNVWMNGFRARRIEDVLKSKEKLGVEDYSHLQVDYTCIPGKELTSHLTGLTSNDPDVKLALAHLQNWDGILGTDSVGGCIYEVARYRVVRNLVEQGLGSELTMRWMGKGFHPLLKTLSEFYGYDSVTMLRLLDNPDSWWVQQVGGVEALLTNSLKQAVEWLRKELGNDVDKWHWGRIHQVIFPHPLGMQKPLDLVFNRGPFPIGGDTDTPCQTAFTPSDPYNSNACAPTFRQIVDMGDLSKSLSITPPGQSGQLGSRHYDDLIQPWLKGEYHPMLWLREDVQREREGRLSLNP